jgi:hypothetical protein
VKLLLGSVVALPLALVVADGCSSSSMPENCTISASNYDQSCNVDTDCLEVSSGDYCATGCFCGNSTINVGALAQFNDDVSKTPIGSGGLICPCPNPLGPCCRHGMCQAGCQVSPTDTLPACSDAGGTCTLGTVCGAGGTGPPDACVYSDEVCCL